MAVADGFDAILIWKREGPFAVMSPQMTRTSALTLLKYTQLSKFYRYRVADGDGLVGNCMLGPVHNVIMRDVATMRSGEFLRLKEAQDCAIRSLCFVKLSHDLVAELVNMDERRARDVLAILPRLNMYIGLMHAELIDRLIARHVTEVFSLTHAPSSVPLPLRHRFGRPLERQPRPFDGPV